MNISIDNGAIAFDSGVITRDISRSEFLNGALGADAEVLIVNTPFATYRIRPETGVSASVRFRGDLLELVSVLFEMQNDTEVNWTRERELERQAIHDSWLLEEVGPPPYQFAWGEIESLFDEKACVSNIIIGYGPRRVEKAWWQKAEPK